MNKTLPLSIIRKIFDLEDCHFAIEDDDGIKTLLFIRDELQAANHQIAIAEAKLKGKEEIIELLKGQLENAKR
jgi:hypothetical protein